jgi:PAS domain S-box-containing protein
MSAETENRKGLPGVLECLAKAVRACDFNADVCAKDLTPEEREAAGVLVGALRDSQAAADYELMKYKLTSDALGIAHWDMDVAGGDPVDPGNKITWSREFRNMLGFSSEEDFPDLISSWSDRLHPDDKDRTLNAFRAHMTDRTGKTPYDLEYHLLMKDGEYRYFRAFGATTRDGAGVPLRVAGALEDITEKKLMQAKIREAEERVLLMLDATPLGCELWDHEYKIIDCNEEAVRFFGVESKQTILDGIFNFSPEFQPDGQRSQEKAARCVEEAFAEGRVVFDWEHRLLDGSLVPVEVTLIRVRYGDDYVIAAYTRDLREQKAMTSKIDRQNEWAEALNEMASVLLSVNDEDSLEWFLMESLGVLGRCANADRVQIWHNETIDGSLHFVHRHEWLSDIGQQCAEVPIGLGIPVAVMPDWYDMFLRGECVNGPVSELTSDQLALMDQYDIKSIVMIPLFSQNQFWGFLSLDDCRGDRTFTEEEINILRSAGIMIINCVNRGVMMQELRRESQAKSAFLATMSHEMRTPLNAVIGMTEIGRKSADMEVKNYALDKIEDSSAHLLGLISDILDMSKIEANKLELSNVGFNFERMLQKVFTMLNFRMEEKRQRFSVNLDAKSPVCVIGDDQRLSQVIANLLSNAVKFTPPGGKIHLDVSLLNEEDGVCELRIEVADTGIGVSKEQQDSLFNAFEQAERGTSREFGGTGLGLAISKRIIGLMGGDIWVESELGKGSRFIFTVKVERGDESARTLLDDGVQWENIRVLVVDDSETMCQYFRDLFDRLDLRCEVVRDGASACRLIEERGGFDIYFIDWRMPDMDGVELIQWIKSRKEGGMAVLISSAEWEDAREASVKSGADKYLTKPILSSVVVDCINECFGAARSHGDYGKNNEYAGKRLLLVEDIEINREIMMTLLESSGMIINCARNGAEALAMVETTPYLFDIIFMDIQMPKMDGLEATRRIRALPAPRCQKIPIIAMTANVFKDDIDSCLDAGMNDHIGKPVDMGVVFEKLREYLPV